MNDDDSAAYAELLKAKMNATTQVTYTASNDLHELVDPAGIELAMVNLMPVRCQTCSEPLGTKADLSAHGPLENDSVLVSLHHSACLPSSMTGTSRIRLTSPTSSFAVTRLTNLEHPDQFSDRDIPVLVVNPSCEHARLARTAGGGWRVTTLDGFEQAGFVVADGRPPQPVPAAQATLDGERLTVTVSADSLLQDHRWSPNLPPIVHEQIRRVSRVVVGLTTKVLPDQLDFEQLRACLRDPDSRIGMVQVTTL